MKSVILFIYLFLRLWVTALWKGTKSIETSISAKMYLKLLTALGINSSSCASVQINASDGAAT